MQPRASIIRSLPEGIEEERNFFGRDALARIRNADDDKTPSFISQARAHDGLRFYVDCAAIRRGSQRDCQKMAERTLCLTRINLSREMARHNSDVHFNAAQGSFATQRLCNLFKQSFHLRLFQS